MPKIDLTITISVILAVCAIVSPIATAIINNHYLFKLKKLELQHEDEKASFFYKRGVYEDYLRFTGNIILHQTVANVDDYGKIYPLALIYFPDNLCDSVVELNDSIQCGKLDDALNQLNELAPKIRTILQRL